MINRGNRLSGRSSGRRCYRIRWFFLLFYYIEIYCFLFLFLN
ncbi:hypothetical protein WCP94_002358 [Bilophila wadsworthia]